MIDILETDIIFVFFKLGDKKLVVVWCYVLKRTQS